MIAILGSGFGLYGYLPALIDGCAKRIVLPERYRSRFYKRAELKRYAGEIFWERSEAAVLDCANTVVFALRPADQVERVSQCLTRSNIERLILEKPLAHSPEVGEKIFDGLVQSRKTFRIGYTFRFTHWGKLLLHTLPLSVGKGHLSIHWNFMAHHFHNDLYNWKRLHASGGGAIRFYGIQVIALLAELGYRDVEYSLAFGKTKSEVEKWSASFTGVGLPDCEVRLETKASVNRFVIEQTFSSGSSATIYANLWNPFEFEGGVDELEQLDQRVPVLFQLCQSLWEENESVHIYEWYDAAIKLWRRVEEETRFDQV